MYETKKPKVKYFVVHSVDCNLLEGTPKAREIARYEYASLEALVDNYNVYFIARNFRSQLGAEYRDVSYWSYHGPHRYKEFIPNVVVDEWGDVIPVSVLLELKKSRPTPKRRWHYRYDQSKARFRIDPVPGIHKYSCGGYYRHIHTTQELRENDFLKYDEDAINYNIKSRSRRNKGILPTAYDDIPYSHGYYSKNWKKYRKHQWKDK